MREWIVSSLGGGATALAIVVAILGLAGALGGAATSYIVASKTVYINAITAERVKWIALLRSNIAGLLGQITTIKVYVANQDAVSQEALVEALKLMNQTAKSIELQLNPDGDTDANVMLLINALYRTTNRAHSQNIDNIAEGLIGHSRWLLKAEWERVKHEAMGPLSRLVHNIKVWRLTRKYRAYSLSSAPLELARRMLEPIMQPVQVGGRQ